MIAILILPANFDTMVLSTRSFSQKQLSGNALQRRKSKRTDVGIGMISSWMGIQTTISHCMGRLEATIWRTCPGTDLYGRLKIGHGFVFSPAALQQIASMSPNGHEIQTEPRPTEGSDVSSKPWPPGKEKPIKKPARSLEICHLFNFLQFLVRPSEVPKKGNWMNVFFWVVNRMVHHDFSNLLWWIGLLDPWLIVPLPP